MPEVWGFQCIPYDAPTAQECRVCVVFETRRAEMIVFVFQNHFWEELPSPAVSARFISHSWCAGGKYWSSHSSTKGSKPLVFLKWEFVFSYSWMKISHKFSLKPLEISLLQSGKWVLLVEESLQYNVVSWMERGRKCCVSFLCPIIRHTTLQTAQFYQVVAVVSDEMQSLAPHAKGALQRKRGLLTISNWLVPDCKDS